jgi:gamma-glutamyltranspeptidase / glutathione hydrolase
MFSSRQSLLAATAVFAICAAPTATSAQANFAAERGDRSGGWLAQSRSEVLARNGVVATSQPLAAEAGLEILEKGGNAVDAAIATAAVLNVVEPESAGMGGDAFALVWLAKEHKLIALNGSGRAPSGATLEAYAQKGRTARNGVPEFGILSVTTPGAVDAWDTLLKRAGTMDFNAVLEPAARIAEEGFAISERVHNDWLDGVKQLEADPESAKVYLPNGQPPAAYSVFRNPDLASAFRALQSGGRDAFYKGPIAEAIVAKSRALGGSMTMEDLANTHADWVEPISTNYHGYDVYELPPNTQGFAALEMLNIIDVCAPLLGYDLKKLGPSSPKFFHVMAEAKKIAYSDLAAYNGDPSSVTASIAHLISKDYARSLCGKIDMHHAARPASKSDPVGGTVFLTTADRWGNMVSFIYSVYDTFGSGITVPGYGFVLQDRGALFSLDPKSPNALGPGKRPFHTLVPAFLMKNGEAVMSFGLMGGDQQAQGQVQVLVDIIDLGANPQAASDAARFSHRQHSNTLYLESGLFKTVGPAMAAMGHKVKLADGTDMGGFQAIWLDQGTDSNAARGDRPISGVYRAASDHRKDGEAIGW